MPTLRNSVINQILNYLEYGDFCVEDFDSQFPDDSTVLAQITFKALPKYTFVLDEVYPGGSIGSALAVIGQGDTKKVIRTSEQPGTYKNHESRTHEDIDSAISRISDWVRSIREDLINSRATLRSTIDELTEKFQQSIDENIDDDAIKSKLDELHQRVSELEEKLGFTPEETKKIEKVIEKSKSDLKLYPKGVWYKTAGTKLLTVMKGILKSKEGREILSDLARKLLQ
jgi:predicted RNase H-like nuclease (RuvC/YqgF family)